MGYHLPWQLGKKMQKWERVKIFSGNGSRFLKVPTCSWLTSSEDLTGKKSMVTTTKDWSDVNVNYALFSVPGKIWFWGGLRLVNAKHDFRYEGFECFAEKIWWKRVYNLESDANSTQKSATLEVFSLIMDEKQHCPAKRTWMLSANQRMDLNVAMIIPAGQVEERQHYTATYKYLIDLY